MNFVSALALGVGLLVVAPVLAHLLKRRRTQELSFAPARWVTSAPAVARRRSRLEDPSLLGLRALAILALALLGATPFFRCSRLALGRHAGGSVGLVIVIDDSLSMRAAEGSSTRWDRVLAGARDVMASAREGDAIAVVAAGAPARVILAATTDVRSANEALATVRSSDRATDLEGALSLATSLAASMPHEDRRIVLLSDLADGHSTSAPLDVAGNVSLWVALPELARRQADCGIVRAENKGKSVSVTVACGAEGDGAGRAIEILHDRRVLGRAPLGTERSPHRDVPLTDAPSGEIVARLTGSDAILSDDVAPVTIAGGPTAVAVVSDATQGGVATGGPPAIEQALLALDETIALRPLPLVPDQADELTPFAAVILDDPPGLTPEARATMKTWLERGGVGLMFLGPRAGAAVLGSAFDPFVPGPVRWLTPSPAGSDGAAVPMLGLAPDALRDLGAQGRVLLDGRALDGATALARWSDGAPLLLLRSLDRGVAITATLSASEDVSDFPLRPAFLALVEFVLETAKQHGGERRTVAGASWPVRRGDKVVVRGPDGLLPIRRAGDASMVVPDRAGLYHWDVAGKVETRVAEIAEAEVDLTPRAVKTEATSGALGSSVSRVDGSPYVAFVLLLVIAGEAALRIMIHRREAGKFATLRPS